MQPGDVGTFYNLLFGILQVGALAALALSGSLAIWRAVTDRGQESEQASVRARH